jgi:hypothetical protein
LSANCLTKSATAAFDFGSLTLTFNFSLITAIIASTSELFLARRLALITSPLFALRLTYARPFAVMASAFAYILTKNAEEINNDLRRFDIFIPIN